MKETETPPVEVEASPDVPFEFESQSFSWMQATGTRTTPSAEET